MVATVDALLVRGVAVLAALALLGATASGVRALVHPGPVPQSPWRPVGQILLLSAVWLLSNSPYEGRVLWVLRPGHGLTAGDLAVLPPLVVAALVALYGRP